MLNKWNLDTRLSSWPTRWRLLYDTFFLSTYGFFLDLACALACINSHGKTFFPKQRLKFQMKWYQSRLIKSGSSSWAWYFQWCSLIQYIFMMFSFQNMIMQWHLWQNMVFRFSCSFFYNENHRHTAFFLPTAEMDCNIAMVFLEFNKYYPYICR